MRGWGGSKLDIFGLFQNQFVDIKCPRCSIQKRVAIKDIISNRTVICVACENKIKLIDKDSSGKKSRQQIRSIEEQIENLFKI